MRYIKVALIITLAMVLFTGCSKDTTLVAEEGRFYLQFNEPTTKPVHIGCQMAPEIRFKSIEEMLRTIKSGRFTKAQMEEVIEFDWDDQGRVILFDLDHVVEPVYPSGYEEIYVTWTGDYYSFTVKSPWTPEGSFDYFIISEEQYHNKDVEHYQNFDQFKECDRVTTENRNGIEVTVFDYTYGYDFPKNHRLCTYTLTDHDTELFVVESYDPDVDLQTPTYIEIFGKSSYGYFNTSVDDFTTRPTPEWLLGFDLRPYNFPEAQAQYETPMYSITAKDGKYILTPTVPLPDEYKGELCYTSALIHPTFTSIKEMRQGILNGPISQYELSCLVLPSSNANHSIEICDPNHLYEFTAPEEFDLKYISWSGKSYSCSLIGESAWGGIDCYDEDDYAESFNSGYLDFLTNPNITVTSHRKTLNRSATVYYGHTDAAKEKFICYELRVGDKKMYIQEEYLLEIEDGRSPVSATVPQHIQFWGTENGGYYYGIFFDLQERPSVEWLCQFGIVPYTAE